MKKLLTISIFAILCTISSFAQKDSLFMFDIISTPVGENIKVYLNTENGRINDKDPLSYYVNGKTKLTEKQIRKEYRIKLKRNKDVPYPDSYVFHYKGLKKIKSYANYTASSNEYFFYTPFENTHSYRISKFIYEYETAERKKIKNIKVMYQSFATGTIKIRDYKP